MRGLRGLLILLTASLAIWGLMICTAQAEQEPVEVVCMTTPFGTPMYNAGLAFEKVFQKDGSWVKWKVQPTPGAMYIVRYYKTNEQKLIDGEVSQVMGPGSVANLPFITEGRPPFTKFAVPGLRAVFSQPAIITMFCTFDEAIKSASDFKGKRVGIAEKSRPFQGVLALKPYFGKGLGIWDDINWQYLGAVNSKEALLNNRIDAHYSTFYAGVDVMPDGTFVCTKMAPSTPTLELINSGRNLHFVGFDPETFKNSHDFSKDMIAYPVLVKKGAFDGLDQDVWARLSPGIFMGHESMPDDVVREIIRVRHKYRAEMARYHAALAFFPQTPYPVGTPEKWVHPGVKKAMESLNIPMP